MSNPVVSYSNTINTPSDPEVVRKTFTQIVYTEQRFDIYGEGQYDPLTWDPTDHGERFYMFVPLADALTSHTPPPSFVAQDAWDETLDKASSGFLTAVNSIMPKLMVPSKLLVDNGLTSSDQFRSWYPLDITKNLFDWVLSTFNTAAIPVADSYKYAQTGGGKGAQFVSTKIKDDDGSSSTLVMTLADPAAAPSPVDWLPATGELVVLGAFCLLLNVTPSEPGATDPDDIQGNPWYVKFEFGEVTMQVMDTGAMKITIGGEDNIHTVNLAEGKSKEGPPQQQKIIDKVPYIILVYPVWNGIVVTSGVQDSNSVVLSSSTYIPRLQKASIFVSPWSTGFDVTAPAAVEVGVGTPGGDDDVLVNFGTGMTATMENCRCELAYLPCYYSREMWFVEWFVTNDDSDDATYDYTVYPIWTKNGEAAIDFAVADVKESTFEGPVADTHYSYVQWRMQQDGGYNRVAGEIFGEVLEIEETRQFPIKNGNGNFSLLWTGGTPGDPSPGSWDTHIQAVTASLNLDGSSANVTVDKYGVAGQEAVATQSVGALVLNVTGANGTTAGNIFQGLALGISEQESSDGANWEIPCVGLETKLEEIALINVPFFDGEYLDVVIDFLTRYAGIIADTSNAPNVDTTQLTVSEDINVARFDWKSGTSVKSALDDVMQDTLHTYVVRDGKIFFYELNSFTGLPTVLGTNWEPSYPNTKVIAIDRSPDFEDLRNEIVVLGLERMIQGQGAKIANPPAFLRVSTFQNTTTPDIPWAKSLVQPLPGMLEQGEIANLATKIGQAVKTFELLGRTTIPGNADIRPYDQWGNDVIYSVSHNVDLVGKTWTTDLELMRTT